MAFNTLAAHRIPTLCLYKHLLRTARQFTDNVQATFLYYTVRERFRFHRHDTSPTQTKRNLEVAEEWLERMRRALQGEEADNKIIENLAWGREGRLKDVLARYKSNPDPYYRHRISLDTRPQSSAAKDSHPAYRIPLNPRVLSAHSLRLPPLPSISPAPKKTAPPPPRKPYQVERVVRDMTGHTFIRVRGLKQPLRVSMMVKKRVRTAQRNIDLYQKLIDQLDMVRRETEMLRWLRVRENTLEWEIPIKEALENSKTEYERLKMYNEMKILENTT